VTTLEMEIKLMHYFGIRSNLIVPCVSDMSGIVPFEVDLLILSKSGYATAIEIKISEQDLKNDLNKNHIKNNNGIWPGGGRRFDHYFANLKHFYYAVPDELKQSTLNQIPEFAGLLTAKMIAGEIRIFTIRKPGRLFEKKWSLEMSFQLARLGAMRILSLKEKQLNANKACDM